jgi:membrane protease YdiL (CAAX protease family)
VEKSEHVGDGIAPPEPSGAHIQPPDSLLLPVPAALPAIPALLSAPAGPVEAAPEPGPEPDPSAAPRISVWRAFGELGAVYIASFGLGVVSAVALLTDPSLGGNQVISGWADALSEITQYIMQAAVVIFGVGYFSVRRGITLRDLFGRFSRPQPQDQPQPQFGYPAAYPPAYQPGYQQPYQAYQPPPPDSAVSAVPAAPAWPNSAYQPNAYQPNGYQPDPGYQPNQPAAGYPQYGLPVGYPMATGHGYGYFAPKPRDRGPSWQFTRGFFLSMGGVLAFLITVIVYSSVTSQQTGAPDQGNSLWMVPIGVVVALAAGFGEELLVTAMVVTTLEQTRLKGKVWLIYLVAIALRIPYHLYYGWASLGVICFTVVNIWIYRRWRQLWPIVLAHTAYDGLQFAASLVPAGLADLLIFGLALSTFVMLIVIACIEISDRSARRRYAGLQAQPGYLTNSPF